MTLDSHRSDKYYLDFSELEQKTVEENIDELVACSSLIRNKLLDALILYSGLKGAKGAEVGSMLINTLIEQIDNSKAIDIFSKLFGIEKTNNQGQKERATFLDILPIVNQKLTANLPWTNESGFLLFNENVEKVLRERDDVSMKIEKSDVHGKLKPLDTYHDLVIKEMQTSNNRSKDIFHMFINMKLAEKFNCKPKLIPLENSKEAKENPVIEGKNIESYIEDLFDKYYEQTKSSIEKKGIMPKLSNENKVWDSLLNAAKELRDAMLSLHQKDYIDLIRKVMEDSKKKILQEIRKFLKSNKPKFHEMSLPTLEEISSIKGGYGLVKRISSNGGYMQVKKDYLAWIIKEKIKEESVDSPENSKKGIYDSHAYTVD